MEKQIRDQVIAEAKELINGDRREQYGDSTFQAMAMMFTAYLGVEVKPYQAAEMFALAKIARNRHRPKLDSYVDGIGYLALAAEEAFGNDADL
jgi:hypothetical protein